MMIADGNSFCGDVVVGSINMAYRNEDSILDHSDKHLQSQGKTGRSTVV